VILTSDHKEPPLERNFAGGRYQHSHYQSYLDNAGTVLNIVVSKKEEVRFYDSQ
jgi:hypothetical protein